MWFSPEPHHSPYQVASLVLSYRPSLHSEHRSYVPEMSLQYIDRAKRRNSSACRQWFLDLVQSGVLVVTF